MEVGEPPAIKLASIDFSYIANHTSHMSAIIRAGFG